MSRHRNQRGGVLLAVILFVGIIMLGTALIWRQMNQDWRAVRQLEQGQQCAALAEGGIERAVAMLRSGAAYTGERDLACGTGFVTVAVTTTGAGSWEVDSTGELHDGRLIYARARRVAEVSLDGAGQVTRLVIREETP